MNGTKEPITMRTPFQSHQISKLPKPTKAQTDEVKADFKKGVRCEVCGGWHHPKVVHLDYVGHAALTDRLLDVDSNWTWEPVALNPQGLPAIDDNGGLWIRLTVLGITRLGYGDAQGKTGGDAMKERIGDALRNAAMRFGAALDLWHKGDLHLPDDGQSVSQQVKEPVKRLPPLSETEDEAEYLKWMDEKSKLIDETGQDDADAIADAWGKKPSNIRTGIKRHGEKVKEQIAAAELDRQASQHLTDIQSEGK